MHERARPICSLRAAAVAQESGLYRRGSSLTGARHWGYHPIFTLINELLLKALPVRDPQTLVAFGQQYGGGVVDGMGPGPLDLFPYEFYKQIEGEHAAFDGVAAYASFPSRLSVRQAGISNSTATQAFGHLVSGNFFSLLGADMALGRAINPADAATPGASPVAVISYQYWQREVSGDRNVLGKSLIVNGP